MDKISRHLKMQWPASQDILLGCTASQRMATLRSTLCTDLSPMHVHSRSVASMPTTVSAYVSHSRAVIDMEGAKYNRLLLPVDSQALLASDTIDALMLAAATNLVIAP